MELRSFEQAYGEEGGGLYCPALLLKVWLYLAQLVLSLFRRYFAGMSFPTGCWRLEKWNVAN